MIILLILMQVNSESISHRYMFPVPVSGAHLISLSKDQKLFSFSGRKSPSELHEGTSILNYDFSSGTYKSTQILWQSSPVARTNYGLCLVENKWIYLFGGIGDEGILGDMWRFDIEGIYWKIVFEYSEIRPRFSFAFTCYFDNEKGITSFAVVGGVGDSDIGLKDFYLVEIDRSDIREIVKMPEIGVCVDETLYGAQLQYVKNYYYLFSGSQNYRSSTNSYFKELCRYSIESKEWKKIILKQPLIDSVHGGSFIHKNSIYYYFGKNSNEFTSQVFKLNLKSLESGWISINQLKSNKCERAEFGFTNLIQESGYNDYILFSSGITKYGYTNSIGYIEIIDDENVEVSCMINVKNSPPRSKASISQISDTLILFGGTNEGKYFNDLWRVNYTGDIHLYNWTLIKALGNYPEPRMGHAAASQGHFMLIAGGMNEQKSYLSDYWLLDTTDLNYRWIEIVPESYSLRPPPLAFSCVVLNIPYFYLIGGESNDFISSEIWRYDLSENIFEKAKPDLISISRHGCYLNRDHDSFYIFFGSKSLDNEPSQEIFNISIINFPNITSKILKFKDPIPGRSNFGYSVLNSVLFIAGGQEYFSKSYKDIWAIDLTKLTTLRLSQNGIENNNIYELEEGLHSMSSATVGGQIILYSGIQGNGETIKKKSSDSVYKINIISYPQYNTSCGLGSVTNGSNCLPCSKNAFKSTDMFRCTKCPKGTYLNSTGGTDIIQCMPCPYGYYASSLNDVECIRCNPSKTCFVGEDEETDISSILEPTQPKIKSPKTNLIFVYVLFSLSGIILLLFMFLWMIFKIFRAWLSGIDLFQNNHLEVPVVLPKSGRNSLSSSLEESKIESDNQDKNDFMKKESFKNEVLTEFPFKDNYQEDTNHKEPSYSSFYFSNIGGLFTGASLIIFFSVLTYYTYIYQNGNIYENVTLVSSSTLTDKSQNNQKSLSIYIDFLSLRNHQCNSSNTQILHSGNIKPSTPSSNLQKNSHCLFSFTIQKPQEFESGDYLQFKIKCSDCYTSDITVAIESDAAYHNKKSRAISNLTLTDGTVLKGKNPSIFFFELYPAMFDDLTERKVKKRFGYRVSSILRPELGSTSELSSLFLKADIKVNIVFTISQTGVYTARMLKVDNFGFIAVAVGALNGSMAMIVVIMKISEFLYLKVKFKGKKTATKREIYLMRTKVKTGIRLNESGGGRDGLEVEVEARKGKIGDIEDEDEEKVGEGKLSFRSKEVKAEIEEGLNKVCDRSLDSDPIDVDRDIEVEVGSQRDGERSLGDFDY